MSKIITILITNPAAIKNRIEFQVEVPAIQHICRWYGAFCCGDPYKIYVDGEQLDLDINGERNEP